MDIWPTVKKQFFNRQGQNNEKPMVGKKKLLI